MKTNLRTLFLLILFLVYLPIESLAQIEDYRFEHLTQEQGLSNNLVIRIFQDSEGFMWFFTQDGLNKYDGYNIEVYRPDPNNPDQSLKSSSTHDMIEDEQGRLWITSWGGGLQYLDKRTDQVHHFILDSLHENKWVRLNEILMSKDGTIWLSGMGGIVHVDPSTFEITLFDAPEDVLSFYAVEEDASKRVWCGGTNGLHQLDPKTGIFTPIILDSTLQQPPIVHHLFLDRDSILWVSTRIDGLFNVDTRLESPQPKRYLSSGLSSAKDKLVFGKIMQGKQGYLWVSSSQGVVRIDKKEDEVQFIRADPLNPFSISHNGVWCVYQDRSENLWVGSFSGVDKLISSQFNSYQIHPNSAFNYLPENSIWELTVDQAGKILFTTGSDSANTFNHASLYCLSPETGEVEDFVISSNNSDTLKKDQVGPLYVDQKNRLWIGTETALLLRDDETGEYKRYPTRIPVFDITEDPYSKLWFHRGGDRFNSSDQAIASFNPENGEFSYFNYDFNDVKDLPSLWINHIMASRSGDIWMSFHGGLARFDQQTENFTTYLPNPKNPKDHINDTFVYTIYEDREGVIWVGTQEGGLNRYNPRTDNFTHFDMRDGLPSNTVLSIIEDKNGDLWLGTSRGLSRFNPKTKEFRNYDTSDGLLSNNYYAPHAIKKEGILVFGTDNGLVFFHPDSIQDNTVPPPVYITRFQVMEEEQALPTEPIELPYNQNFLSFDFVALNYQAPEKNAYAYQMEGLDQDWVESGDRRFASYTDLDPGEYTFRVKASHNKGPWNEAASAVQFTILPPWWQTWWAYALYVMLALGAIVALRHYELKRFKLRQRATHLAEMDSLKSRFFANISHEFRTPLTLILGPLKAMYDGTFTGNQQKTLGVMVRNGQRLLNLINQLLDISKLEAGKMQLQAAPTDLVTLLRHIAAAYRSLAEEKNIKYFFYPEAAELIAPVDQGKLEKVVHNLLSNAFKFTPAGGEIIMHLKAQNSQWASISVKDTGQGIPEDELDKVFDRFYQVDSSQTRVHEGSGLGMALAKELVTLHHGKISVASQLGKGATFTVQLPLSQDQLSAEETQATEAQKITEPLYPEPTTQNQPDETAESTTLASENDAPLVLVVEDHPDMRQYIHQTLASRYQIKEASNGQEGVQIAKEMLPDLIISDVMMPEMNGYQLCEQLKSDEVTSHIPVMLLTAKADRSSKLSGLELGADDYLAKPFDQEELRLLVRNRIAERQKMREHFSREITLEPTAVKVSSLDEKFLQRVMQTVEEYIADPLFGVEVFSEAMGMSRMQLYRKLKALTDQSPNEFVRRIRLQRAANLLAQEAGTIADIAYQVGFHDPSYFTKMFQKQFGKTPSEYQLSSNPKETENYQNDQEPS
jgi:signal transduction histidine kinase/ligand-binding sensor domain-containing protein/CheY-like chemotaxis protein